MKRTTLRQSKTTARLLFAFECSSPTLIRALKEYPMSLSKQNDRSVYVIVLSRDTNGPVYLGRLDCGRQGVRRIENAVPYKTRSRAELVARDYSATVEAYGTSLRAV